MLLDPRYIKSVLNLQMTYIIIAHIYDQWDRVVHLCTIRIVNMHKINSLL